ESIPKGKPFSITLSWSVKGKPDKIEIENLGTNVDPSMSSVQATPSDTTEYVLKVTNADGVETTKSLTVEAKEDAQVVESFTASPEEVEKGGKVTLSWKLKGEVQEISIKGVDKTI